MDKITVFHSTKEGKSFNLSRDGSYKKKLIKNTELMNCYKIMLNLYTQYNEKFYRRITELNFKYGVTYQNRSAVM